MIVEKKIIPSCPRCGNKDTRARIKTEDMFCRRCGYIGKRKEFFKETKIEIISKQKMVISKIYH